ncbi:unnamed protein product, partial [Ectocarpus sp. 12 AP-2014]
TAATVLHAGLLSVQLPQAGKGSPLPNMQPLCPEDGPPLPLGRAMCRCRELQGLPTDVALRLLKLGRHARDPLEAVEDGPRTRKRFRSSDVGGGGG